MSLFLHKITTKTPRAHRQRDWSIHSVYSYLDVAFAVRTRDTVTIDAGDVIPFDDVISNVGNAYVTSGSDRGKFIAPYNGTYQFNVILMTFPGNGELFLKSRMKPGGFQLRVENKIVPIEISYKIDQMVYKL